MNEYILFEQKNQVFL